MLRKSDTNLIELACGPGSVFELPGLQGRIFCQLDGELIHRLDAATLASPSAGDSDRLGGNSLTPAPPKSGLSPDCAWRDQWLVQPGINLVPAARIKANKRSAIVEKRIALTNRKGCELDLTWRRIVEVRHTGNTQTNTPWPR